jgi:hypothetical protein
MNPDTKRFVRCVFKDTSISKYVETDGSCGLKKYTCAFGTVENTTETSNFYRWYCAGSQQ